MKEITTDEAIQMLRQMGFEVREHCGGDWKGQPFIVIANGHVDVQVDYDDIRLCRLVKDSVELWSKTYQRVVCECGHVHVGL